MGGNPHSFPCHLILFVCFAFVFVVFFRTSVCYLSLGERSHTLHLTYVGHLDTLGTVYHFSFGGGVDISVFFLDYFCCLSIKK